jgi:hypothetical protein
MADKITEGAKSLLEELGDSARVRFNHDARKVK